MDSQFSPSDVLLANTRRLLRRYDLHTRKRLGQHFLICEEALKTIIDAAELSPADIVLEVGSGLGVLTRELAKAAGRVIAVELDDRLAEILKETLASRNNLSVINMDILKVDPFTLIEEQIPVLPPAVNKQAYKLVANLPYYITAPVLRHFLEAVLKPQVMVLTIQKEVAETIVAEPGDMRLLSVSVQFYGKPEIIARLPAQCFHPAPEVDSAIIKITPHSNPDPAVTDVNGFFHLVKAGFGMPRKQLINPLMKRLELTRSEALALLQAAGVSPERRAETMSLAEWIKLWQVYSQAGA